MQLSRLLLIDDHTLFRTGLRLILSDCPRVADILEAGSVMEAIEAHSTTAIDLILLDIQLPGLNGLDGVQVLRRYFHQARILIVSGSSEQAAAQAAQNEDICGYLPKTANAEQIETAIACCLDGLRFFPFDSSGQQAVRPKDGLTPRQLEVLEHLCLGRPNKVIAHQLSLAENTVRVHVSAILEYFGVYSRVEAVLEAQRRGWVRRG